MKTLKTNFYQVINTNGYTVDILEFETPLQAIEFENQIQHTGYRVEPSKLSAEAMLRIMLDARDYEMSLKPNEYLGQVAIDSGEMILKDAQADGDFDEDYQVQFETGYGDGLYEVYAKRNEEGKIIRIQIDMDLD